MEVFHGLTPMDSLTNLDGFYPEFSSRKGTNTITDMLSMAYLSGISSDVEHLDDYVSSPPVDKPVEQPVYSPQMTEETSDNFDEKWFSEFLPLNGPFSPPVPSGSFYQPVPPVSFASPPPMSQGGYISGVLNESSGSYPSSPHSHSTLDGSDISDLLDIVDDLPAAEPSPMYSFGCSPPQTVPDWSHTGTSTIQDMLSSPPAMNQMYSPNSLPYYTPHPAMTESTIPRAKDLGSISDVEKLLMSPLPISQSLSKKRQRSKDGNKPTEKKMKKKEQNKTAALRYRQKKRQEKDVLTVKREELEQENGKLKDQVDSLEREIGYLKDLLEEVQRRRMSSAV